MRKFVDCCTLTTLTACLAMSLLLSSAHGAEKNVEHWVDKELAPYLARELSEHPRFRNATVKIVAMSRGQPAAETDELSLQLRDQLQRSLTDRLNIDIAWQPAANAARHGTPRDGNDCSAGRAQYVIGIELQAKSRASTEVSVRALDAVEKTWVTGVGATWQGALQRRQWAMARTATRDRGFLGQRSVPYDDSESDLLAAHLAHDLRCELMRKLSGEYVVAKSPASSGSNHEDIAHLVSKNISGLSALRLTSDPQKANALLQAQAFPVDGDLHQYWITLTPINPSDELQPISTNVYVRLPTRYMSAAPGDTDSGAITLGSSDLLTSTTLVRLDSALRCQNTRGYDPVSHTSRHEKCLGLEVATRDDAVIFVLKHQQNNGLVRLGDRSCRRQAAARISKADAPITVTLPDSLLRDSWVPESRWLLAPGADTYYTIAVSNSRAARAIAQHLEELPRRCTESMRPGLEGGALSAWLTALSSEVARWQPHVDWNAIKIKNIY